MDKIIALTKLRNLAAKSGLSWDVARFDRLIARETAKMWAGVGTN